MLDLLSLDQNIHEATCELFSLLRFVSHEKIVNIYLCIILMWNLFEVEIIEHIEIECTSDKIISMKS